MKKRTKRIFIILGLLIVAAPVVYWGVGKIQRKMLIAERTAQKHTIEKTYTKDEILLLWSFMENALIYPKACEFDTGFFFAARYNKANPILHAYFIKRVSKDDFRAFLNVFSDYALHTFIEEIVADADKLNIEVDELFESVCDDLMNLDATESDDITKPILKYIKQGFVEQPDGKIVKFSELTPNQ
ncbi:hypothetical protein AGMMS50222_03900 [Endomicrobiia bacterium]|nr:hypothetical protein AGMMS50222_03900 [Endomicrobiia bacterium]